MLLLSAHHLGGAVVVDVAGAEQGLGVVRAVGRKLLQVVVHLLGDVLEVNHLLNVEHGLSLFGQDVLVDILLETATELGNVLDGQRQTDSIGVATKVFENVTARLHGIVDVIASH